MARAAKRAKAGGRSARAPARTSARPRAAAPAAAELLAWYDRHRRELPWRARPGETPDPYRVWLSEIMLQQTTVTAVAPYFQRFLARWPQVGALAAAPLDDVLRLWAGLGYYARARNLHACARTVTARHGGRFPRSEAELRALPGIGPYTAAAIAAIAFETRTAAVDGNVERVVTRLYAIAEALPAAKPRIRQLTEALVPATRSGDFAQALMDLGATVCTPRQPGCGRCPWVAACLAHRRGTPEDFPKKAPKPVRRLRRGAAFVAVRPDGSVMLRTRPPRGLLGGMSEVPTTEWSHEFNAAEALVQAKAVLGAHAGPWRRVAGAVTHVFTHFPLELIVFVADVPSGMVVPEGARFVSRRDLADEALPNLMRKVLAHALAAGARTGSGRSRPRGRLETS
jgi:A/G-specific adenine glycosylase